jgi:serine/threonine protein kinase
VFAGLREILETICILQDDVKDVQREVEILNLVSDHPNVAELVNCFEDSHHVHLVRNHPPLVLISFSLGTEFTALP